MSASLILGRMMQADGTSSILFADHVPKQGNNLLHVSHPLAEGPTHYLARTNAANVNTIIHSEVLNLLPLFLPKRKSLVERHSPRPRIVLHPRTNYAK
jgi:hypothetical protein